MALKFALPSVLFNRHFLDVLRKLTLHRLKGEHNPVQPAKIEGGTTVLAGQAKLIVDQLLPDLINQAKDIFHALIALGRRCRGRCLG